MSAFIDIHQRDEELYLAYKKAFSQPNTTHIQAVQAAIHTPTSRYWVSPYYVYRDIRSRLRGYRTKYDPVSRRKKPRAVRATMYDELFQIYKSLTRQRYFRGYSTYFLVSFVINHQAPCFYIELRHAQRIIARMRKEAHYKHFHPSLNPQP